MTSSLGLVRGAAGVEVDLREGGEALAEVGGLGERRGLAPTQLHGQRVLAGVVADEGREGVGVVEQRIVHRHLAVEERPASELPHEEAEVPVRPLNHGRDGEHIRAATALVTLHRNRKRRSLNY